MSGNVLITCSTGGLGISIIDCLLSQEFPVNKIFAHTRDLTNPIATSYSAKGITLRGASFLDQNSWTSALDGIYTLMFISCDSKENRFEQHKNVLNAAKEAGVKHIMYTSTLGCSKESKYLPAQDHLQTEEFLKSLGISYTIFRNSFYIDQVPVILGDALVYGVLTYPAGNAKVNFVAESDVAKGIGKVLSNIVPHVNKVYEIASCKSYTFTEIALIISKAAKKEILYDPISIDEYKASLTSSGLSEVEAKYILSFTEAVACGQFDCTDSHLDTIIEGPTKTMEEYLPVILRNVSGDISAILDLAQKVLGRLLVSSAINNAVQDTPLWNIVEEMSVKFVDQLISKHEKHEKTFTSRIGDLSRKLLLRVRLLSTPRACDELTESLDVLFEHLGSLKLDWTFVNDHLKKNGIPHLETILSPVTFWSSSSLNHLYKLGKLVGIDSVLRDLIQSVLTPIIVSPQVQNFLEKLSEPSILRVCIYTAADFVNTTKEHSKGFFPSLRVEDKIQGKKEIAPSK